MMKLLPARDSAEFSAGMLLGMVLGAGLGLVMAPERTSREAEEGSAEPGRARLKRHRGAGRRSRPSRRGEGRKGSRFEAEWSDLGREFVRAARDELASAAERRLPGFRGRDEPGSPLSVLRSAQQGLRALRRSIGQGKEA